MVKLDKKSLEKLNLKGYEDKSYSLKNENPNGIKVRRVTQLISDYTKKGIDKAKVLDIACGEGAFSIEAAIHGANVTAIDAREERMNIGRDIVKNNSIRNIEFKKEDLRMLTFEKNGKFDVVLLLGVLYHLDVPDSFRALENIYEMTDGLLIIDTHIAMTANESTEYKKKVYKGVKFREHYQSDTDEDKLAKVRASVDNEFSFWFTKDSLIQLLHDLGFSSVLECHAPIEPLKSENRVTLVALKGRNRRISTYPWVNNKSNHEIEKIILEDLENRKNTQRITIRRRLKYLINKILEKFGLMLTSIS